MDETCAKILNYENCDETEMSDVDKNICKTVLSTITRDTDGRLVVPLMWHDESSQLLSKNLSLCKQILKSMKAKLDKVQGGLELVDSVITEQIEAKIIEPIENLEIFLENNPTCSFLAHMPIFKESSRTTKYRVVYLSNLKEKTPNTSFSHNQSLLPGPQMNRPIEVSLTLLRFNKNLLIYDLKKAFLQLKLTSEDSNRLCFLWFKDAKKGNFTIKAYRCLRLPQI